MIFYILFLNFFIANVQPKFELQINIHNIKYSGKMYFALYDNPDDFNSGDVMIFLSDGLPEATNVKGEMLGYEAVYDCMLENIEQDPQTLLDTLSKLGENWIKGTLLDDDITLLVVRKN